MSRVWKTIIIAVAPLAAGTLLLAACSGPAQPAGGTNGGVFAAPSLKTVVLEIPTIACSGCWARIDENARGVPGVREVEFDERRTQRVVIAYDPSQTSVEDIVAAIEQGGDDVTTSVAEENAAQ